MRSGFAFGTALLILAAGEGIAATPPPGNEAVFQRALADGDYNGAGKAFNALVMERLPASSSERPDPLLDRLLAESIAAHANTTTAVQLLNRITADAKLPNLPHYQLLLATAEESGGDFKAARSLYVQVSGSNAPPDDRLAAAIGNARVGMLDDPQGALAVLRSLQPRADQAWEVDLIRARAATLAGQDEAAQQALHQAWAEAPAAEPVSAAPAQVAADLLVDAGRRGDRRRLVAMLAVDRLNRIQNGPAEALAADLPVCGTNGITNADQVAVEVLRQAPPGRPRVSLVWASRHEIAEPFLEAIASAPPLIVNDGSAAPITLRCRTTPSSAYQVSSDLAQQVLTWSTARGAYPLWEMSDSSDPAALASALADRERRYGTTSVMLLPVLEALLGGSIQDGLDTDDKRRQAATVLQRIGAILTAEHAPDDIILLQHVSELGAAVGAQTQTPAAALAKYKTLLEQAAANPNISFNTLYSLVLIASRQPEFARADKAQLVEQVLALSRQRTGIASPETTALALQLMRIRAEQGDDAAAAKVAKQQASPLTCATMLFRSCTFVRPRSPVTITRPI